MSDSTPTRVHLTLETVRAAARQAYEEGRLGFQVGETGCHYFGDETNAAGQPSVCAIGAALPPSWRTMIFSDGAHIQGSVKELIDRGRITVPERDVDRIKDIQKLHDEVVLRYPSPERDEILRSFVRAIGA